MLFNLPPLPEQKAIAHILGRLDDKIELNRQMNQTLEAMAQALFKSWFVDFDPVMDNLLSSGNMIPDELQSKAEKRRVIANRSVIASDEGAKQSHHSNSKRLIDTNPSLATQFPSAFEFDEVLGKWVPEGWEVKTSGELIDVRDGTHDSPKQSEIGYPLITSRHITSGYLDFSNTYLISEKDYLEVSKRSRVQTGDILLTMIGTVGIPCLVLKEDIDFAIKNVGLFRTSESPEIKNYFFQLLKTGGMQSYLEARMAGTTQKYLSLKVLRNIELVSPRSKILSHYNTIQESWDTKIHQNQTETETLSQLRDRLLPELISGRVRLKMDI